MCKRLYTSITPTAAPIHSHDNRYLYPPPLRHTKITGTNILTTFSIQRAILFRKWNNIEPQVKFFIEIKKPLLMYLFRSMVYVSYTLFVENFPLGTVRTSFASSNRTSIYSQPILQRHCHHYRMYSINMEGNTASGKGIHRGSRRQYHPGWRHQTAWLATPLVPTRPTANSSCFYTFSERWLVWKLMITR